ncbi:hypothetical protein GQ44DRAFT_699006 [Phaeosphaeriaceae sp. PMI808]|nr:hypothetical protein GQ44DRAFT_699006 [Phaeosphaeriaceae sp. PMI808]
MKHTTIALVISAVVDAVVGRDLVIAIYGGGPASATLALALKDYKHIDLQYFDPALNRTPPAPLSYAFGPLIHDLLEQINDEASGVIERAGFFEEDPRQIIIGEGVDTGTVLVDYTELPDLSYPEVIVVDPVAFLGQMLNGVDKKRLHANQTLISIREQVVLTSKDYPLSLELSDGTIFEVDVLIGDDGPRGRIRSDVLGAEHPATLPVFMNFLTAVAMTTFEEAKKYLPNFGDKLTGRRFEHVGQGVAYFSSHLETFFGVAGFFYTAELYDINQFVRPTTSEEIIARFGRFESGGAVARIFNTFSNHMLIPETEHRHAPTYIKNNIVMMGAAAHHMTNFKEPGTTQGIEDAMILAAVLGEARGGYTASIEAALLAYDSVRRPRSQWVSNECKRLGLMWSGMLPDVGLDVKKLRAAFLEWKRTSESFDAKKHKEEALMLMREKLEGGKPQEESTFQQAIEL